MPSSKYDLRENIYLIGDVNHQIVGNKLPNKKQVLRVLFFNMRRLNLSLRESAIQVVKEVIIFWDKAGIPVRAIDKCADKVVNLYQKWRTLQKHAGRNNKAESDFVQSIELLFDIAGSADVIQNIESERLQFLENQRKRERIGFIGDFQTLYDEELTAQEIEVILAQRKMAQFQRESRSLGN